MVVRRPPRNVRDVYRAGNTHVASTILSQCGGNGQKSVISICSLSNTVSLVVGIQVLLCRVPDRDRLTMDEVQTSVKSCSTRRRIANMSACTTGLIHAGDGIGSDMRK